MNVFRRLAGRAGQFMRDEDGPSGTEYAILLALLILGAMGTIAGVGSSMDGIYAAIKGKVEDAGM